MSFALRRTSLLAALATVAAVASNPLVHAAVPEPQPSHAEPAAHDSSQFLPRWLHMQASVGLGWIAGPAFIRERYEAGQDFELGVEARPRPGVRLRLNGEYQVLPAVGVAHYQFVAAQGLDGSQVIDTLSFDWRQRGWLGASRLELQWRVVPHVWLMGGAGRGYLGAGVRAFHFADPFQSLDVTFPGSSGWAWIVTQGVRYDFDLFGPMIGVEVRHSALERTQDTLQMWSVRIGWQGH